ncbi:MAG: AraC family transcriptional regulator [Lachnospiraceae bacterium]|nr:AraC family transcriptional regulator [Ruminococcus sp.]MCM1274077.1 AraC family transcriptional regulator [Lachnospiraceae bacterium]
MTKETRTLVYDEALRVEAYRFEGVVQPFPKHFHEHYVVGLVESGARRLSCNNREYALGAGDMLLLNPGDSHGCVQTDGGTLDYRALNISAEIMTELSAEITGESAPPRFSDNVTSDGETAECFRRLHDMIMRGEGGLEKEEALLILISALIRRSGEPFLECVSRDPEPIERACRFMDERFAERISLERLCECSGLSKSTLLRSFAKAKGVTPYRYLQAVRVGKAKELLEKGEKPIDAALQTGFFDQSHFTNAFGTFIGLPPSAYRRITGDKENEDE